MICHSPSLIQSSACQARGLASVGDMDCADSESGESTEYRMAEYAAQWPLATTLPPLE